MARAYSAQPQDGQEPQGGEWQALRGELVALLDQVESQVARVRRQEPEIDSLAERMRDIRFQVTEGEPDTRQREALRQVRRAVDRFNDRDELQGRSPSYAAPAGAHAASPAYADEQDGQLPNPRDMLQSAIRQIRARHNEIGGAPQPDPAPARRAPDTPRFDELAHAVGGISGRLERLEVELKAQGRSQTGNVKEIAEQVGQLSHVVELLAGAVGETGQVRRLEGQIAGLAKLVTQGPAIDLSALTKRLDDLATGLGRMNDKHDGQMGSQREETATINQRLDDVTATMGRLADLQVQFANRVDGAAQASAGLKDRIGSMDVGIKTGMDAVEAGVRNIYDRIDAIEKNTAMPPVDVDRLTEEMARFTEALKTQVQPQGLLELVDELNRRIGAIESSHHDVGGLKADAEAMRQAVVEAVEPRFAAIEMQIEALSDRVADRPADISVGQLEAQVRQLVARMDQTGEQLTGLARLYSQPGERDAGPDLEALADMVAARASEAMALHVPMTATAPGFDDAGIDEIERRVSRLMLSAQRETPSDVLSIETSIREVNDRLARLETSLTQRAEEELRAAALPVEPIMPKAEAPLAPAYEVDEPPHPDPIGPLLAEAEAAALHAARSDLPFVAPHVPARADAMPASPDMEAPLVDRPFGNGNPVAAALEAKNGPRKHPGLSYEAPADPPARAPASESKTGTSPRPEFDPEAVVRPPRPVSSFDTTERAGFAPETQPDAPAPRLAVEAAAADAAPSTNTFIAAARRAAQRQQQHAAGPHAGSGSLIARAFANFQAGSKPADAAVAADEPATQPQKEKKARKFRALAGDKPSRTDWSPEPVTTAEPKPSAPKAPPKEPRASLIAASAERPQLALDQEATTAVDAVGVQESFLLRHRRPILLAAAIVAISLLTLNLVAQRLANDADATPVPPTVSTSSIEPSVPAELAAEPLAKVAATMPRIIPMTDSMTTASVDPAAAKGFSTGTELAALPVAFVAPGKDAPGAAVTAIEAVRTASAGPLAARVTPLKEAAPPAMESPVQVDMPPEALGPEALRKAAAQGEARAQFEIAAIYTEGRAVPEDAVSAAVWYERAAAQGFAPAQYRLGNLYENGRGVAKDLTQAKLWYQRAAEAGNRMAMHNLAALYASGEIGKQEFGSAAEWFQHAAERGMRDSQFNLGMLHARGLGVAQSFEESYKWFSLAALRGDADAAKARDDVARSLDAAAVLRLDDEIAAFRLTPIDLVANFAPIGTWSPTFDPGQTITDVKVVKSVQLALGTLGYEVGTPDGLAGPRTAEAIRSFERATGMTESGAINPRLLAVLGSQPV